MKRIEIFSGNEIEAMAIENALKEIEIYPIIKNEYEAARLSGFGNSDASVKLFVQEKEVEEAIAILQTFGL